MAVNADTGQSLSSLLNDDDLWSLIHKCDVPMLKALLAKGGVPTSARKDSLQTRLFYCIRLGLPVIETEDAKEKSRKKSRADKLAIGSTDDVFVPHPLTLDNWDDSAKSFPDLTVVDIEFYFDKSNQEIGITTRGQKALRDGKSIFISKGRVHSVKYHDISPVLGVCFIQGCVVPQTRVSDSPYYVWVMLYKATGLIKVADCHCIAGLSGLCKHVAALLYFIEDKVSSGDNKACTSTLQQWHKPRKDLPNASFVRDINIRKANPDMVIARKRKRDDFDPRPQARQVKRSLGSYNLDRLADITNGKAAILTCSSGFRSETSRKSTPDIAHVVNEEEVDTSSTIKSDSITQLCKKSLNEKVDFASYMNTALITNEESVHWIERETASQRDSPSWFEQRLGRMTASRMHEIISHVDVNGNLKGKTTSLLKSILTNDPFKDGHKPKPILWGEKHEAEALASYQRKEKKCHKQFCMSNSGLWISVSQPFIAGTPDSLIECVCCGKGLVEVKCPWTLRNSTITEFAKDPTTALTCVDGQIQLKTTHKYYAQVQTQMYCAQRDYCDFVVMTKNVKDNLAIVRVKRDDTYIDTMVTKASIFWRHVLLPEIKKTFFD